MSREKDAPILHQVMPTGDTNGASETLLATGYSMPSAFAAPLGVRRKGREEAVFRVPPYGCRAKRLVLQIALEASALEMPPFRSGMETALSMARLHAELRIKEN